ncbi:hypothetical protein Adt_06324 [Abeliophyllum distichum]|uniref:Uncharacterized protein n=1 Tax=Abeliophyllum distichum TaxID=126358 RepID=A0ABD1V7X2_9LAMI
MEDVLPIRGIDISTGEEMAIASNLRLAEVGDPFITDPIRWSAMDVPSIMRTLLVNPSGEVVLESPPQVTQNPGSPVGGPYDSKKKLRELIGAPGLRMLDDALQNVPFYPSMGTQKVVAEALEVANKEKRRLLDKAKSHKQETQSLRENLEVAEKGRKEAKAEVARLLGEKKEMEAKLGNVEAEFVANFHNTEAYTNFSDYFAKDGHQEVLTVLRIDHPRIDLGPLEARFPPPDVEGE